MLVLLSLPFSLWALKRKSLKDSGRRNNGARYFCLLGGPAGCGFRRGRSACEMKCRSLERVPFHSRGWRPPSLRTYPFSWNGRLSVQCLDGPPNSLTSHSADTELLPLNSLNESEVTDQRGRGDVFQVGNSRFHNKFLVFARLGSVINEMAESFFKSEIRRRLFVTALLILVSRIGYFIPLPGFDRRLIPEDYLTFTSGSMGKWLLSWPHQLSSIFLFLIFTIIRETQLTSALRRLLHLGHLCPGVN